MTVRESQLKTDERRHNARKDKKQPGGAEIHQAQLFVVDV
jgi:hypothetical protein